ncbi:MAG: hypothetical protein DSY32_04730 [Aquifex sp.]|nr:MAG: hypothetical protein DSY32_04730 [Aquifex sp.]
MRYLELKLITPELEKSLRIKFISLEDKLGSFSIFPNHTKFITELIRSIGHFIDERNDFFYIAHDHGFLKVEKNVVLIVTRAVVIGKSVEELKEELNEKLKRITTYERDLRKSIETFEKVILKRLAEIEKGE